MLSPTTIPIRIPHPIFHCSRYPEAKSPDLDRMGKATEKSCRSCSIFSHQYRLFLFPCFQNRSLKWKGARVYITIIVPLSNPELTINIEVTGERVESGETLVQTSFRKRGTQIERGTLSYSRLQHAEKTHKGKAFIGLEGPELTRYVLI